MIFFPNGSSVSFLLLFRSRGRRFIRLPPRPGLFRIATALFFVNSAAFALPQFIKSGQDLSVFYNTALPHRAPLFLRSGHTEAPVGHRAQIPQKSFPPHD